MLSLFGFITIYHRFQFEANHVTVYIMNIPVVDEIG